MDNNLEYGLDDLIKHFTETERKHFDERIDLIEKQTLRLFTKTYDHSLNINQLKLLRRQLLQTIFAYEFAMTEDKFQFIAQPHLKERLTEKQAGAIKNLKNALTIVETKLQDRPQKKRKVQTKHHNLLEIWEDKSHYLKVINFLKEENPTIQSPFVKEDNEKKLIWVCQNNQYLGHSLKNVKAKHILNNRELQQANGLLYSTKLLILILALITKNHLDEMQPLITCF